MAKKPREVSRKGGVRKTGKVFRDATSGRFLSKEERRNLAARAYGAMNLRGKYGRAADTLMFKTDLSEEQSRTAFKRFMHSYGDWLLGKINARPDLYKVAARMQ
jgi:hypothetical protein